MTVLEAINEYKKCIDEIAQLLFVFASVIGDDRVEAGHLTQLGWTIGEVKGYHTGIMRYDPVKRIKDAIIGDMPDKKELQKRLAYVWHELSEEVAFIEDEETGYFPVFDEKNFSLDNKELFNVLCKLESKNYAFTVLTHLEGVVHWTNTRISEVYKMLCELSDFAGIDEKVVLSDGEALVKIDGIHLSGGEQEKKSQPVTKKKKVTKNKNEKFSEIIQCDRPNFIERLHFLIDGKGGKHVGLVFRRALDLNYIISIPTQGQFESEFELKGTWPGIYKYMVDDRDGKNKEKANKIVIFEDE